MTQTKKLIWIFLSVLVLASSGYSAGFLVDPSLVKTNGIVSGKNYELISSTSNGSYFISVTNNDNRESKYRVEILSCKQYGCRPYFGYEDIPDTKWIKIKSPVITVPGRQIGYMKDVYIKVPKKKEYYGKKYQAVIKVIQEASATQAMNLEVVIPLWVEIQTTNKYWKAKI